MRSTCSFRQTAMILASAMLAVPAAAFAYDGDDAIRDCENRIRDEYQLTDLRDPEVVQLPGDKHYSVKGKAKVDGKKYHWTCEVKKRHVTRAEYDGPKHKEMGTAEKLAIGAAAAVAIGVAVSQANKHKEDGQSTDSQPVGTGASELGKN